MRPQKEYHEMRMLLRALLENEHDGPVVLPSKWSEREREFMTVTSAHTVLLYHIAHMCGFDAEGALEGYTALTKSTRKLLFDICDETDSESVQ